MLIPGPILCALVALCVFAPASSPRATELGAAEVARIRVFVRDAKNRPLQNAEVLALAQRDPALRSLGHALPVLDSLLPGGGGGLRVLRARSTERGLAELDVPPGRLYRIWARSPDGAEVSSVRSDVQPGESLRLSTLPASTLRVPLEGIVRYALYALDRDVREEFLLAAGTAADELSFSSLPPGSYRLRLVDAATRAAEQRVVLRPSERRVLAPTFLAPAQVRVELRDAKGAPVPLASVQLPALLEAPGEAPRGAERRVPALDLVLRLGLVSAAGLRIDRELGPFAPGEHYVLRAALPPLREVELRWPAGASGLAVCAWRERGRLAWRSARIAANGDEALAQPLGTLPQHDVLLLYWGDDGTRVALPLPEELEAPLAIEPEPGARLELTVRLDDGRPARGASVLLYPVELQTAPRLADLHPPILRYADLGGRVRIPSLVAGQWQLRVQSELFVPDERMLSIAAGQELEREITLQRGMRLHGVVRSSDGAPAAGVLLTLQDQSVGGSSLVRETSSDAQGHFAFTGLADGFYLIEARRHHGSVAELARRRALRPSSEPVELRLRNEDPPLPGGGDPPR